jgi:hypothetical protein
MDTTVNVHGLPGCCGIRELTQLSYFASDPAEALRSFAKQVYTKTRAIPNGPQNFRYVIFSQANSPGNNGEGRSRYGEKFAAFIQANGLGDVIETAGTHINPNSTNVLKVYVWTVDHLATKKWAEAQGMDFPDFVEQPAPPVAYPPRMTSRPAPAVIRDGPPNETQERFQEGVR